MSTSSKLLERKILGVKAQQKERKNMKYVNQDEEEVNCISRLPTRRKRTLKCLSLKLFPMWFPSPCAALAFSAKYFTQIFVESLCTHTYLCWRSFRLHPAPNFLQKSFRELPLVSQMCWRHQHAMKLKLHSQTSQPSRAQNNNSYSRQTLQSYASVGFEAVNALDKTLLPLPIKFFRFPFNPFYTSDACKEKLSLFPSFC